MGEPQTAGHGWSRFSTRQLPERDRLAVWREQFGRTLVRVDIQPASEAPFHAQATLRTFPGFRTMHCANSPMLFRRNSDLVADGDDSIGLVVNLQRQAVVSKGDTEFRMGLGDAVPILTDEPADLLATGHLGMLFPRAALASRVANIDQAAMTIVPRRNEALRLLLTYVGSIHGKLPLTMPGLSDAVVNHIYDLAALALDPERAASCQSAVVAARLAAALDVIAKRFADPELNTRVVAQQQNISPRYLQQLFEGTGQSFSERVSELRLRRAFELLTASGNEKRKIMDIALDAGFSDISYFNRLFRARFGDTPTGIRGASRPR